MKVVIFDMDGTLIDSARDITATINHVRLINHGLEPLSSEEVVEIINRPVRNLAKLFYGTENYETRDKVLFESHYYDQCTQNPQLYPGIDELLATLFVSGVKLSVATNAPSLFACRMLSHLGILERFDHVVGPDTVGASKPDPEMLHHILKNYGFDYGKHHAWMVGDNQKDMDAARHAGIGALYATWGFTSEAQGDEILASPLRILEIVFPYL